MYMVQPIHKIQQKQYVILFYHKKTISDIKYHKKKISDITYHKKKKCDIKYHAKKNI